MRALENKTQIQKMTSYTRNFQNFTYVFRIFVKFHIYFLVLPGEIPYLFD